MADTRPYVLSRGRVLTDGSGDAFAASNPLPVAATSTPAALGAGTSRSGAITTGGDAQDLAVANAARTGLTIQNISAGDLWVNENGGTAAAAGTDAYLLPAGATARISTNEKVSIIGATTGQKFTATEI